MPGTISAHFFDGCGTCIRHSERIRCCCDHIAALEQKIVGLEKIIDGHERFISVTTETQTEEKVVDIRNAVQWCENELAQEKQYNSELEDALIAVETENWLAREVLQSLRIDSTLPLREGILTLAKRIRK